MSSPKNPDNYQPQATNLSSGPAQDLTYWQRIRELAGAGSEDYAKSSFPQRLGLLATAAWITYEWGPGNEALIPIVASQVLKQSEDAMAPVATGLVSGLVAYTQQSLSGATSAYTASAFPKLSGTAYRLFNQPEDKATDKHSSWRDLPLWHRVGYSFLLGSTFAVAREATVTGNAERKELNKAAQSSARITGLSVTALGAFAGSSKWIADGTAYENGVDTTVEIAGNPLTWLGLFGSLAVLNYIKRKASNLRPTAPSTNDDRT